MPRQPLSPRFSILTKSPAFVTAILLLVFAPYPSWNAQAQGKSPYDKATLIKGLKQSAVDKLISPQEFIQLIEQRGVDFQMNAADEGELRIAGATNEVIIAIKRNYRWASEARPRFPKGTGGITIHSNQGSKVFVNGKLRGTISESGLFRLSPLKAGEYKVILRKDNYEELERSIIVNNGTDSVETFGLSPKKGNLTIIPNLAGATVRVRENDYPDAVRNLSLEPGDYEIRISKPGYRSLTRTVTVSPGQPFTLPVTLEVLKIEEMIAQGLDHFRKRNYAQAIVVSKEILSAKPEEPKANLILGMSYFYSGNYDVSVGSLVKAVALGEQVVIPVQRHTKFGMLGENDNLTPGLLIIGKNLLEFRTSTGSNVFSVPLNKVYRVIPEDNRGGRVQIKVGDPKKKKDGGKDYNFHPIQAALRRETFGTSVKIGIYCGDCLPISTTIYQVIEQTRQASPQSLTP